MIIGAIIVGTPIDTVVAFKNKNNYGTQNKSRNK